MTKSNTIVAYAIHPDAPRLRVDPGGVIRIGDSRVSLDQIIHHYESGATPEDMVRAFDTLNLADVYGAIAYYLRHRVEISRYLEARLHEAAELRQLIESKQTPMSKQRLLERRHDQVQEHVASRD